jgi:hypothetical protein
MTTKRHSIKLIGVKDGSQPFFRTEKSKTPYFVDTKNATPGVVLASNLFNDTYKFKRSAIVWLDDYVPNKTVAHGVISDVLLPGLLAAVKAAAEGELQKITDADQIAALKAAGKVLAKVTPKNKSLKTLYKTVSEILNEF